jgi:hypothetical protein
MKTLTTIASLLLVSAMLLAQTQQAPTPPAATDDYSGMYSFRREGEFVQVTVEDAGRVTGFISRYGNGESDQGAFLNQFFKQGKLEGNKLAFSTETVHGVWFDFKGTVERGPGKTTADEAYYVLKGTLTENRSDSDKKPASKSTQVTLKSFPREGD